MVFECADGLCLIIYSSRWEDLQLCTGRMDLIFTVILLAYAFEESLWTARASKLASLLRAAVLVFLLDIPSTVGLPGRAFAYLAVLCFVKSPEVPDGLELRYKTAAVVATGRV